MDGESYVEYALFNRIFDAQTMVRENLNRAKMRSKQYYDRKANPQMFKKDVYLLKEPTKGKLDKQYTGPYKIIESLKNNNIKIAISDRRVRILDSDKLNIYRTRLSMWP